MRGNNDVQSVPIWVCDDGVAGGGIFATVVQQPDVFGYDCMAMMAKYFSGDKSVIPQGKILYVPTLVIDASNVADYQKTLSKIRGKWAIMSIQLWTATP